jgi:hypothetical protein
LGFSHMEALAVSLAPPKKAAAGKMRLPAPLRDASQYPSPSPAWRVSAAQ